VSKDVDEGTLAVEAAAKARTRKGFDAQAAEIEAEMRATKLARDSLLMSRLLLENENRIVRSLARMKLEEKDRNKKKDLFSEMSHILRDIKERHDRENSISNEPLHLTFDNDDESNENKDKKEKKKEKKEKKDKWWKREKKEKPKETIVEESSFPLEDHFSETESEFTIIESEIPPPPPPPPSLSNLLTRKLKKKVTVDPEPVIEKEAPKKTSKGKETGFMNELASKMQAKRAQEKARKKEKKRNKKSKKQAAF
jgi:hypothetical protein